MEMMVLDCMDKEEAAKRAIEYLIEDGMDEDTAQKEVMRLIPEINGSLDLEEEDNHGSDADEPLFDLSL
ncbi:MAG: hypothetical protein D6732_08415 [Methanobacteriota archaeon]|nr:MAG: hypothetical protein D6732_08415 [Euryarchaeota archaeon]